MPTAPAPSWQSPWQPHIIVGSQEFLDYIRLRVNAQKRARQRSRLLTIYTYGNDNSQMYGKVSGRVNTVRPKLVWQNSDDMLPIESFEPLTPDLPKLPMTGRTIDFVHPTVTIPVFVKSVLQAWLIGATMLAIILGIVRALILCVDKSRKKYYKAQLQEYQEWLTSNVHASSQYAEENENVIIPDFDIDPFDVEFSETSGIGLPPPYTEYTDPDSAPSTSYEHKASDIVNEEPPPPYSDCYVEFSNKNGIPSVLIFSRKRTPLVNRREIVASEVINIVDDTNQNMEHASDDNIAITVSAINDERNDDANATINVSQSNLGTSADEEFDNPDKDRVILV